ncbi:MAG: tetratricopeptide repeat protein [bacterium]
MKKSLLGENKLIVPIRLICLLGLVFVPLVASAHLDPGADAPSFVLPSLADHGAVASKHIPGQKLLVFVRGGQRFTTQTLDMCRRLSQRKPIANGTWQPILIWMGPPPEAGHDQILDLPTPPWRVLLDAQSQVGQSYRVVVSPTLYLVNSAGKVTEVFPGWHPLLEKRLAESIGVKADAMLEDTVSTASGVALQSDSERAALYFQMARNLAEQGYWKEALQDYDRGLELDSNNAQSWAEAACAASMAGAPDRAESLARRALEMNPKESLAQKVLFSLRESKTSISEDATTMGRKIRPVEK